MPSSVGNAPYQSTIPTLSDGASIVDAFKYYHTGGLTGSIFPNSIQYHIDAINNRAGVIEGYIGYTGISPTPASVQSRLSTLETIVNTNISSLYIKTVPSSNDNVETRNIISPSTSSIVPLIIQGVIGQTANLQEWKTNSSTIRARVDNVGRFYSFDGTTTAEVATISGTQTLTNKIISGGSITGATSISVTGAQALATSRVRNIYIAPTSSPPSNPVEGEIWLVY